MDKSQINQALKELREKSPKRNFSQSIDIIFLLKDIDMKKNENRIDTYIVLPNSIGRKVKICGLVDQQLVNISKKTFDHTIVLEEFKNISKEKKIIRKLAKDYDFFVAQANIMSQVATTFGKILGPKKKMPNPKAGCVVPGTIPSLDPIVQKLNNTIKLYSGSEKAVKICVGKEAMKDEELTDNIIAVYNFLLTKLPQEKQNIKDIILLLIYKLLY